MERSEISLPLGELELAVMEHLWEVGAADVKTVHTALARDSRRSLNTTQSTLERLSRKGILSRRKHSRAFVYEPALSREAFLIRTMSEIAASLGGADSNALMATFVELAGRDDAANLDRLEQLIEQHRRRGARDD